MRHMSLEKRSRVLVAVANVGMVCLERRYCEFESGFRSEGSSAPA